MALMCPLSLPARVPGVCLARTDIKMIVLRCFLVEAQLAVGSLWRRGSLCGVEGWAGGVPSQATALSRGRGPGALLFFLLFPDGALRWVAT